MLVGLRACRWTPVFQCRTSFKDASETTATDVHASGPGNSGLLLLVSKLGSTQGPDVAALNSGNHSSVTSDPHRRPCYRHIRKCIYIIYIHTWLPTYIHAYMHTYIHTPICICVQVCFLYVYILYTNHDSSSHDAPAPNRMIEEGFSCKSYTVYNDISSGLEGIPMFSWL